MYPWRKETLFINQSEQKIFIVKTIVLFFAQFTVLFIQLEISKKFNRLYTFKHLPDYNFKKNEKNTLLSPGR